MTTPATIGRYRIDAPLGAGGMAETYLATLLGTEGFERKVAIKRILPGHALDPSYRALFLEEAKILSGLHHANIAQAVDAGEIKGSYFLAIEYVDGVDLRRLLDFCRISGIRVPIDVAIHIAGSTAAALHYAHTHTDGAGAPLHIVHRDVTPANILIDRTGHVKLSDFGIALYSARQRFTGTGMLRGNQCYMSPEHLSAKAEPLDARADLFSLGIVLYEMLAGQHPFLAASSEASALAIRAGERDPLVAHCPFLPRPLLELAEELLATDKRNRPVSAEQVEERLAPYTQPPSSQRILGTLIADAKRGTPTGPRPATKPTVPAKPSGTNDKVSIEFPLGSVLQPKEGLSYSALEAVPSIEALPSVSVPAAAAAPALARRLWPLGVGALSLLAALAGAALWARPPAALPQVPAVATSKVTETLAPHTKDSQPAAPVAPVTQAANDVPTSPPPATPQENDQGSSNTPSSAATNATLTLEVPEWGYVWLDGSYRGAERMFRGLTTGSHTVGISSVPRGPIEKTQKLVLKAGANRKQINFVSTDLPPATR